MDDTCEKCSWLVFDSCSNPDGLNGKKVSSSDYCSRFLKRECKHDSCKLEGVYIHPCSSYARITCKECGDYWIMVEQDRMKVLRKEFRIKLEKILELRHDPEVFHVELDKLMEDELDTLGYDLSGTEECTRWYT